MRLHVRTWNVFHGNAHPPRRAGFLRRMIELATVDEPDVLCLQEVPSPALARLAGWSGMRSFGAVARPAFRPGRVAHWITGLNPGLFRSALSGQANAILVHRRFGADDLGHERISDPGRERRLVHAVRLSAPGGGAGARAIRVVVANLHASNEHRDPAVPRAEAERARAFAERLAGPGETVVLAGDFNVADPRLDGYAGRVEGIDHVLVRDARLVEVASWPPRRRRQGGVVFSDHAPVDAVLEVGG